MEKICGMTKEQHQAAMLRELTGERNSPGKRFRRVRRKGKPKKKNSTGTPWLDAEADNAG